MCSSIKISLLNLTMSFIEDSLCLHAFFWFGLRVYSRTLSLWPEEGKTPQIINCLQQVARYVPKIGRAVVKQAVAMLTVGAAANM